MPQALLQIEKLAKRVSTHEGSRSILKDINLSIQPGDMVGIEGVSGSGKTTLLHLAGTLDLNFEGDISWKGQSLRKLPEHSLSLIRQRHIAFVFQESNVFEQLSVKDNLVLPFIIGNTAPDHELLLELLEKVGLNDRSGARASTLSGGERQRLTLARALSQKPDLLICDEPTGHLDAASSLRISKLLANIVDDHLAVLIATHDRTLFKMCSRQLTLDHGQLTEGFAR